MANERTITVRLGADSELLIREYRRAEKASQELERGLLGVAQRIDGANRDVAQGYQTLGAAAAAFGAAGAAAFVQAARAAVDYQSAFAGVRKTVDGTDDELAAISAGLRDMATRDVPMAVTGLADIAASAGQLGIQTSNVLSFTRTIADLGVATNLAGEQAAQTLAQFANITQMDQSAFDRLGSTIVALGNNTATTEADIAAMALRLASAGTQAGMTEADILALSAAARSVGIEAEAGGTAFSRVLIDMRNAVMDGSEDLDLFASTAGMSAEQFAAAFRDNAAVALVTFTEGLAAMEAAGQNSNAVLDELGLADIRVGNALRAAATAGDLFRSSLELGNAAWEENTALTEEAATRYETVESRIQFARNAVNDLAIEVGEILLPAVGAGADAVQGIATSLANMPQPVQLVATGLGGLATTAGLAAGSFLLAAPRIVATKAALDELASAMPRTVGALRGIASFLRGPWGIAIGAGVAGLLAWANASGNATRRAEDFAEALKEDGDALGEFTRELALSRLEEQNALEAADALGISYGDLTRAIFQGGDALEQFLNQDFAGFVQFGGRVEDAGRVWVGLADAVVNLNHEFERGEDIRRTTIELEREAAGQAREEAAEVEAARAAYAEYSRSLRNVPPDLIPVIELTEEQREAMDALTETLTETFTETFTGFRDPLGAYNAEVERMAQAVADSTADASDSWEDYADDVDVDLGRVIETLRQQNEAARNWETNMASLVGRVSTATLQYLAELGPQAAPLIQALADAPGNELADFDREMTTYVGAGVDAAVEAIVRGFDPVYGSVVTTTEAGRDAMLAKLEDGSVMAGVAAGSTVDAYERQVRTLPGIGERWGEETVSALAAKLRAGTATLGQISRDYQTSLVTGINPILIALGRQGIRVAGVTGHGGVTEYADGGFEDHSAQIAPAGAMRLWAEPETGGEAYIPLAPAKRARSLDIWRETGRRLGVDVADDAIVERFADGGFSSVDQVPSVPSVAPYASFLGVPATAVMERARSEVVEWLKANLAPVLGPGIGWQAMWAALQQAAAMGQIPAVQLFSAFRPGAITATGNRSYHGMGRAVDITPSMPIFEWLLRNYGAQSREIIYSPAGHRQIRNGRPHWYSEPTRGDHWDHIHWAMANGGFVTRGPISATIGEAGPEAVVPLDRALNVRIVGWDGAAMPTVTRPEPILPSATRPEPVLPSATRPTEDGGPVLHPPSPDWPAVTIDQLLADALREALGAGGPIGDLVDRLADVTTSAAEAAGYVPGITSQVIPDSGVVGALGAGVSAATATSSEIGAVIGSIQQLQEAWEQQAAAQAEAARRAELWAEIRTAEQALDEAQAAVDAASSADERAAAVEDLTRAEEQLADAIRAVQQFDIQAAQALEERAIAEELARLEAEQRLAANREQWEFDHATHPEQLRMLEEQMAALVPWSDAWVQAARQHEQISAQIVADAQRRADELDRVHQQELDELQRLRDQQADIRRQMAEAEKAHDAELVQLAKRRDDQIAAANARFLETQRRVLEQRRDQLVGAVGDLWAAVASAEDKFIQVDIRDLDRFTDPRAFGVGDLTTDLFEAARANLSARNADLAAFNAALGEVRALGLSEDAIALLGLDTSPESLAKLQAFAARSAEEIAEFNRLVVDRQELAGDQVAREQRDMVGEVGRQLRAAHDQLVAQLADANEAYHAAVADANAAFAEQMDGFRDQLIENAQAITAQMQVVGAALAELQKAIDALAAAEQQATSATATITAGGTPSPSQEPVLHPRPSGPPRLDLDNQPAQWHSTRAAAPPTGGDVYLDGTKVGTWIGATTGLSTLTRKARARAGS